MTTRKDGEATREKLLEAAAQVFGERGFVKATHAEICRLAGVNTALINFHFGSKDALYRAVWERVTADVERRYPLDGGVPPAAPAADRLHGHIRTLLHRALDPHLEGFHRLRTMEFVHPTGMLDAALTANLQRHRNYLRALLRALLGPAITERALDLCEMSVISQCLMIMPPPGRGKRKPPLRFVHADVEELAAHITRFSLAGLDVQREAGAAGGGA